MNRNWRRVIGFFCCCGVMSSIPFAAYADMDESQLVEALEIEDVEISDEDVPEAAADTVQDDMVSGTQVLNRTSAAKMAEEAVKFAEAAAEEEAAALVTTLQTAEMQGMKESSSLRQRVVDYALTFLGCPYRYGGNDPRTGVDCSGFTRFVLSNAAGIQIARSSGSQATQGIAISADQMQPGDLIFYGDKGKINHVAMYIGSGKVVHASTYKTGVKISDWNYRNPLRIINVIG